MIENRSDIDISRVMNGWVILYQGREVTRKETVLSLEKKPSNKKKLIAATLEELINRDGKKCRRCAREEWLTIEHVVPVHILRDMGVPEIETYADPDNLLILCKPCNSFKAGRLDFSDPRTKRVLMRLLEKL